MVKHLTFRILVDNTSNAGLATEHGFAVWVECDDKVILFDTGHNTDDSDILFINAKAMGCDLTKVDYLVLSHGHYDHTGSISQLLAINPTVKLLCHPQALIEQRYSLHPGKLPRQIAMPEPHRMAIHAMPPERLCLLAKPVEFYHGVGFSGAIPREHPLEDTGGPFYLDKQKEQADLIEDDTSMWFLTEQGAVILTGCCHSGLINTLQHIGKVSGEERVAGIIGGLHLNSASAERLAATVTMLSDKRPAFIIPSHCTGEYAIEQLKITLKGAVSAGGSGRVKRVI